MYNNNYDVIFNISLFTQTMNYITWVRLNEWILLLSAFKYNQINLNYQLFISQIKYYIYIYIFIFIFIFI